MTTITGTIANSGGIGLTGFLRVTLDAQIVDIAQNPDKILAASPVDFSIVSGAISISLSESQTSNTTYRFQFFTQTSEASYYFEDGGLYTGPKHFHTDSKWYTGGVHTVNSALLFELIEARENLVLDFHAIVPNVSSVEFADLIPTGTTTDVLDTSLRRLAELLTSNIDYSEALRGGPRWKEEYVSTTYYSYGDSVTYGGSLWIYINSDPAAGQTPSTTNPSYWQLGASKGDPGGTGGQDTAYDSTGWNGALFAPTANAIRDKIETLAPLASPELTGNPTAPTQLTSDETTKLATTLYVVNKISAILAAYNFTTQSNSDSSQKAATTAFVKNVSDRYSRVSGILAQGVDGGASVAGLNTRTLNTIETNAGDVTALSANTFTLRAGTYYLVASAPVHKTGRHKLLLFSVTASSSLLIGSPEFTVSTDSVVSRATVSGKFTIAASHDLRLLHSAELAQATNGLGIATNLSGATETYAVVEIWRVD